MAVNLTNPPSTNQFLGSWSVRSTTCFTIGSIWALSLPMLTTSTPVMTKLDNSTLNCQL